MADIAPAVSDQSPHIGTLVRSFFGAISQRRLVSIEKGLVDLRNLNEKRELFGRHRSSLDLELTYLIEISGDYATASEQIHKIHETCVPFDPARRDHLRSRLYYADILTMKGEMTSASDILLKASEQIAPSQLIDWAELVRQRAHAYRFSYLFEPAEALYLRALEAVGTTPSMIGKLKTNLAETRCWFAPHLAIINGNEAIELNDQLGNQIEISKAHNALAIAHVHLKQIDVSQGHQRRAELLARGVKYPAGVLFSKVTQCIIEASQNRVQLVTARRDEIQKLTRQIGIYDHLNVLPCYLDQGFRAFDNYDFPWIEADGIDKRIRRFANSILKGMPTG